MERRRFVAAAGSALALPWAAFAPLFLDERARIIAATRNRVIE
jgi:hypothetical protein